MFTSSIPHYTAIDGPLVFRIGPSVIPVTATHSPRLGRWPTGTRCHSGQRAR